MKESFNSEIAIFIKSNPSDMKFAQFLCSTFRKSIGDCRFDITYSLTLDNEVSIRIEEVFMVYGSTRRTAQQVSRFVKLEQFISVIRNVYPELVSAILFRINLFER